ncbi:MAG: hypothetical protein R3279_07460, partial [Putridiphycobacter sp.]|nr:hypothetical protein [Putridiphycobacter sp.]
MRIISENCSSSGSSSGNVLPTPPTNLSLSLNGSNEPTGAFTLSTDPTVTSHRVYRRPIATTNWTLIATVSTGVFTDTNVPADGDWQYKVVSVNSIGESIEETSSQMQSINVVTASTLSAPTNIEVTQADPSSNNIVTFDDSQTNATTLIIFREVVLSGVPANQTRQQVASVNPADGINSWEDTYLEQGKEYIYDVQSSDGTNTTNVFNYGDNAVSYTSLQPIATVTGIVFDEANDEYLLRNATDALSAPWSIKMTFQEMSHTSGTVGMFGTDSSATYRFIAYPGSNYMRMNVPPSLQTSGTFTNAIDFVSRNEREVYCEAAGDVYYKASPTATPQFLFNIDDGSSVPNFLLNTLIRAG